MRIILFLGMIARVLSRSARKCSFINNGSWSGILGHSRLINTHRSISSEYLKPRTLNAPYHLSKFQGNSTLFSKFSDDSVGKITSTLDSIRDDEVALEPVENSTLKKNLFLRAFPNLTKYVRELNAVYEKATFLGCTMVERKKELDSCILHFRGYERGESLCLCFHPKYFPLFPTVSCPYRGVTERTLEYFEHVLSGLTGLRVSRIHTPYPFRSLVEIEFSDTTDMDKVLYKLLVISEKRNRLLLVDNTDQVVLGSSECLLEEDTKKHSEVGKKLKIIEPKKIIPRFDETLEEFITNFKNLNATNVVKALITVYEGIDYNFVASLCSDLELDPSTKFYQIPDITLFHSNFTKKVKETLDNEGPYEDSVSIVYQTYGSLSPTYQMNRLIEVTTKLSKEFKEKLEKAAARCEKDENYEKQATLNQKIEDIEDYESAIKDVLVSKDPKKIENLEDFQRQLLMINDLPGFKESEKKKKVEKQKETKTEKKTKKVGKILNVPLNDREDSPLLIVGKNAKQNEVVTHDLRRKGDLWLHAKDCPGGHVILRNFRNDDYSVQIAADVASFFSKYKSFKNVEVVVADILKVKKEKNSQLGAVVVQEFKTLVGSPERGSKFIKDFKTKSQT